MQLSVALGVSIFLMGKHLANYKPCLNKNREGCILQSVLFNDILERIDWYDVN